MTKKRPQPANLRKVPRATLLRPTPIYDAIVDATNGEPLATFHGQPGGEWDYLREVPLRTRRRLTSAGYMARGGLAPDQFHLVVTRAVGHIHGESIDDVVAWYVRDAGLATGEMRAARHHARHKRVANDRGYSDAYSYRDARAVALGFESYWHMRVARGWRSGHERS